MLYSGFNILPRSVFWSANFNGRSHNLDVIPLELMNQIETKLGHSKFVPESHLLIKIDGESLDAILSDRFPDSNLEGLVPTTLNWLQSAEEQDEVWRRFGQRKSGSVLIPILCCPDDLDFSCTLIVVDAKFDTDTVYWLQFGFDTTSFDHLPGGVCSSVDWFDGVGPFVFDRDQYETMARRFEQLKPNPEIAG